MHSNRDEPASLPEASTKRSQKSRGSIAAPVSGWKRKSAYDWGSVRICADVTSLRYTTNAFDAGGRVQQVFQNKVANERQTFGDLERL